MRVALLLAGAAVSTACGPPSNGTRALEPTMHHGEHAEPKRSENEQLIRRLYDEYVNPGRLDGLGAVISSDFTGPNGARGPEAFAATMRSLRAAFPDLVYTLEEVVADDDRVAVRWTDRKSVV